MQRTSVRHFLFFSIFPPARRGKNYLGEAKQSLSSGKTNEKNDDISLSLSETISAHEMARYR